MYRKNNYNERKQRLLNEIADAVVQKLEEESWGSKAMRYGKNIAKAGLVGAGLFLGQQAGAQDSAWNSKIYSHPSTMYSTPKQTGSQTINYMDPQSSRKQNAVLNGYKKELDDALTLSDCPECFAEWLQDKLITPLERSGRLPNDAFWGGSELPLRGKDAMLWKRGAAAAYELARAGVPVDEWSSGTNHHILTGRY